MTALEPVTDVNLREFCKFLHSNLSQRITVKAWLHAFNTDWFPEKPNYGFLIRDQDRIVGGIGAIYSIQLIRGKPERFCNITSWCVLDAYRSQSMRLAMAIVSQNDFHFTDLTPTAVVAGSLGFLKFKPLDERRTVMPNVLWPAASLTGVRIVSDTDEIEHLLPNNAARVCRDHLGFPWLKHLAVGTDGRYCHVIFKRQKLKRLPCAAIFSLSDPDLFVKHHRVIGHYFLTRHGLVTTRVETRLLNKTPRMSVQVSGYQNKMFRSDTLSPSDITNLYSELMALDL